MGIVAFGQIQFLSGRVIAVSVGKRLSESWMSFRKCEVWEDLRYVYVYIYTHMYIVFCYSQCRVETLEWDLADGKMELPAVLGLS